MLEYIVHGVVIIMVIADLYQHWTHHRRIKKNIQPVYTLDQARVILFAEALSK